MSNAQPKVDSTPTSSQGTSVNSQNNTTQNQNNSNSYSYLFLVMGLTIISSVLFMHAYFLKGTSSAGSKPDSEAPVPAKGFETVTFNSLIKLINHSSGYRLHSQEAKYGTGSGQYVVSGIAQKDSLESFWIVMPETSPEHKAAGTPIECGDVISLQHLGTEAYLHSHEHLSPISREREISGFSGHDSGDNWRVMCLDDSGAERNSGRWLREKNIHLKHVDTDFYLASSLDNVYPNPISGHLEVFGTKKKSKETRWSAQEGLYFPILTE